jgi:hypothetical protein
MDPEVTIRPAVPADLAEIEDLLVAAKLCQRDGLATRLATYLSRSPDTCFVSVVGEASAGF